MLRLFKLSLVLFALSAFQPAAAQQSIVDNVLNACKPEIQNFCSNVRPGNGRLLACFYAHEDKLTVQCLNALYDGMVALDRFIDTLSYVANRCRDDIKGVCGRTVPGEGRIAACLVEKKAELTASCRSAIDEVGLQVQ